jgi:AraC-like DNA-binding protein
MRSLKALSHAHGGKLTVQSGIGPGKSRDYWLIMETFHGLPAGGIIRSAQIHRSWGMIDQRMANARRKLKVYSLVYLTKGEGAFLDERSQTERVIKAGDLLCLFPGVGHVYTPAPGTRWNEINIEFSGPAFDAWMGTGLVDPSEPIRHLEPVSYWLKRFHQVVLPLAPKHVEPTVADTGRLVALIAEMCATWQNPQLDSEVEWANQARSQLLALPPQVTLELKALAKELGLGEQAYRKKFKRLCGVTPSTFHARHVIEQACHHLIGSNLSMKEIGFSLGFGTEYYFFRRFKQITGVSPGEYRRRAAH